MEAQTEKEILREIRVYEKIKLLASVRELIGLKKVSKLAIKHIIKAVLEENNC